MYFAIWDKNFLQYETNTFCVGKRDTLEVKCLVSRLRQRHVAIWEKYILQFETFFLQYETNKFYLGKRYTLDTKYLVSWLGSWGSWDLSGFLVFVKSKCISIKVKNIWGVDKTFQFVSLEMFEIAKKFFKLELTLCMCRHQLKRGGTERRK